MGIYQYEGRDIDSRVRRGRRSAAGEQELYELLKEEGIFLTMCRKVDEEMGHRDCLKPLQLSEFCRQLAAAVGAGIPIARAFDIIQVGSRGKRLSAIYGEIQSQICQGRPLSDALEASGVFPDMMVNMFRAAETSGRFRETAAKLAVHYQKEHRMNSRIENAVLYPKILCVAAVAMILVVFLVVMPTVEPLF